MRIRPAVPPDGHGIGETHAASWIAAYEQIFDASFLALAAESRRVGWPFSLERLLVAPSFVLVAERDAEIVGFAHAGPDSQERAAAEIYGFYTHPRVWGSGAATLLMTAAYAALTNRWHEVVVWTLRDASRARRFYEKVGFRTTGDEKTETLTDWTTGECVERPAVEYIKFLRATDTSSAPGQNARSSNDSGSIATRFAGVDDASFLEQMLVEAINWNPAQPARTRSAVLSHHENRHYVDGWPRRGDLGVVAEDRLSGPVGAAWLRFFPARDPGYGFITEDIPEVSIAVIAKRRGAGIGDRLLSELENEARRRGLPAVSLSVEPANPALHLYERRAYRRVASSGSSYTMRLDL